MTDRSASNIPSIHSQSINRISSWLCGSHFGGANRSRELWKAPGAVAVIRKLIPVLIRILDSFVADFIWYTHLDVRCNESWINLWYSGKAECCEQQVEGSSEKTGRIYWSGSINERECLLDGYVTYIYSI